MLYHWNGSCLTDVFVLPAAVADQHIRMAGSTQLKVLLWFSRNGGSRFDAAACAAAIGVSAADCADALQYWLETGVLVPEETADTAADTPKDAPTSLSKPKRNAATAEPITSVSADTASGAATEKPARSAIPHPQMGEVIRRQKKDAAFAYLLNNVSARLGRPITNPDMETLLYLYDTAGLPVGVILMVVGYAVSREKANLRYIEKTALDWADRGIDTPEAVELHLCHLDRQNQAWAKLETVFGICRTPTVSQLDRAEQWVYDWKLDDALMRKAYEICLEKTGKFQMTYIARILEGWREDGIQTPEQTEKPLRSHAKSTRKSAETSLDTAAYEQMLDHFVPVFPTEKA